MPEFGLLACLLTETEILTERRYVWQIATPSVVRKVLRLKAERPSLFASDIRELLLSQRLCDPGQVPSVSSINRILREAATATSALASEWPTSMATLFSGHPSAALSSPVTFPMISALQMDLNAPSTSSLVSPPRSMFEAASTSSQNETATPPIEVKKRKKISYAIEDLLKKDDS